MPMAANYTCRACSRALSRSSSSILQTTQSPPKSPFRKASQTHRSLSTTAPSLYHASHNLLAAAKAQPEPRPVLPKASRASTPMTGIARKVKEKAPMVAETYIAYAAAQDMIKECAKPGDYRIPQALEKGGEIPTDEKGVHLGEGTGWWYDTLGLAPTFINWAQITFIHMYMLQVRFRMFPETHAPLWIQHLTNHAFYAAEDRLVVFHKINANSLRQKYLKDMFSQWRAVLLSYDEGLVKGDAVLATAIWRNLLGAKEDVDFEKLAQVVGYMRREIRRLDLASDDEVANGTWKFQGDPGQEAPIVKAPSRMMSSEGAKA